jgi:1,4-dihydroxy-2-naphthoate polyprenyltransferase
LISSVVAVSSGLVLAVSKENEINFAYAALTYIGVICLHASIDLLNDYWDYKRGIDTKTFRTKYSGGTGVLPDKLLTPSHVYIVGLILLILGALIGTYFAFMRGIMVVFILGFAIVAVYFYSSDVVNFGLGEFFVAIKGAFIVIGSYYVQTATIDFPAIYLGTIIGILSAAVLIVNSFPDFDADRSSGRRTLVILFGKPRTAKVFKVLVVCPYILIICGVFLGFFKFYSLLSLISLPLAINVVKRTNTFYLQTDCLVSVMRVTLLYSRATSIALTLSLLL